uniref:Uncharacterized protein n=1 Tax=Solanum tuberosum TaxID=4113 RepID=M1DN03_SOLTU
MLLGFLVRSSSVSSISRVFRQELDSFEVCWRAKSPVGDSLKRSSNPTWTAVGLTKFIGSTGLILASGVENWLVGSCSSNHSVVAKVHLDRL